MLDIRLIRAEPERVKAELAKVGFPAAEVDALLEADRARREAVHAVEQLRAERTTASKAIRDITDPAERERAIAAQRGVGERIDASERAATAAEDAFTRRLLEVPNLPHPDAFVHRSYGESERLPWDFIDHRINKSFLWVERRKALLARQTPPCDTTTCTSCAAC